MTRPMRLLFLLLIFLIPYPASAQTAAPAVPVEAVSARPVPAPPPPEAFPVLPPEHAGPIQTKDGPRAPFPTRPGPGATPGEMMYLYDALPIEDEDRDAINDRQDLALPHRSQDDIANWLMQTVPQAFTFSLADLPKRFQENSANFTQNGLIAYRDYLQNSGYLQRMQRERLRLSGFTELQPILLNEGAAGNVYKWLFDVPVRVSLVSEQADRLRDLKPITQLLTVRVQVTRVTEEEAAAIQADTADVKIELFAPRDAQTP